MTDLNTAIAKYKHICKNHYKGYDFPVFVFNDAIWKIPPDYEHDANLYMALFEEMSSEFFLLSLMQHDYDNKTIITGDYRQGHNENIPQFVVESQPIGTAICLAYCKLNGLECEG